MSNVRTVFALAVIALVVSLSVAPAAAEYPPTDPPDSGGVDGTQNTGGVDNIQEIPTQVGGIQATNDPGSGSANLAFTGRTVSGIAGLGAVFVVAGSMIWFVGQRRRLPTS